MEQGNIMGLIEQMELKKIKDNGDKVELIFNVYVGSNIPEETPIVLTKKQLKTLIDLAQTPTVEIRKERTDVDVTPIERATNMLHL